GVSCNLPYCRPRERLFRTGPFLDGAATPPLQGGESACPTPRRARTAAPDLPASSVACSSCRPECPWSSFLRSSHGEHDRETRHSHRSGRSSRQAAMIRGMEKSRAVLPSRYPQLVSSAVPRRSFPCAGCRLISSLNDSFT